MQKVNRWDIAPADFAQAIISNSFDDVDIHAVRFELFKDGRHQSAVFWGRNGLADTTRA